MSLLDWTPSSVARSLVRRVLAIPAGATTTRARGFRVTDDHARVRLDAIGLTFAAGYHAGLDSHDVRELGPNLDSIEADLRGFAYEGAGMALALRDRLRLVAGHRLQEFLEGPGARHAYVVHVGAGWAQARLRCAPDALPAGLDPLLRWLAVDGHGFHQGFFHWRRHLDGLAAWRHADESVRNILDQGLGRSAWFVEGMDPGRIAATIERFPQSRRPSLWSGIGLACAYAGGAPVADIEALRSAAGDMALDLAQGACFAAEAHALAGTSSMHCAEACRTLCGLEDGQAAALARSTRPSYSGSAPAPAALHEAWRRDIRRELAAAGGPA